MIYVRVLTSLIIGVPGRNLQMRSPTPNRGDLWGGDGTEWLNHADYGVLSIYKGLKMA